MSIDALTQAKSTLEGVRGALGIYSKTEVDMTLGMLDRAIAKYTSLDAICQDLQEKTYTQAMRIAELEAKLAEAEKQEPVAWIDDEGEFQWIKKIDNPEHTAFYTHPQPKREWVGLTDEDRQAAFESLPDMLDGFLHKWGWLHFSKALEAKLKEKNT